MAGHSKWATIKRKKAAIDSKRGKLFTKALREIQVAAKLAGGSVEGNPRLRSAVAEARALSVPNDNIERAIKRGSGDMDGVEYEEVLYEGYGPGGVAILVEVLTDNRNRTASEVRNVFLRQNGSLGSANSVAFIFSRKGLIHINNEKLDEEKILEFALDAGASDVVDAGDCWEISCQPDEFEQVKANLEKHFSLAETSGIKLVPSTTVKLSGEEAQTLLKLLSNLEDLDDVQKVHANFDIDESELDLN